jgi:hypothetical protein
MGTPKREDFSRTSTKHADRPAAADIAFCVAAFANGMTDDRIERGLEDDYLSRDSESFNTSCLYSENHGKGERLGPAVDLLCADLLVLSL